jgi:TolB-like protein/DNA-binding winged helix-turn-helix (wHTH) protein/Tfp pilus assembly protein PilF
MAEPDVNQDQVQFGPYVADLRSGELRKYGLRVKLQDRPFEILAMLLRQPGRVVTREEMRARFWPEGTFVDFDHNISTAVRKLRDVLGDSAATPRYIETVGRRGYRLIVPIESPLVSTVPPVPEPPVPAIPIPVVQSPQYGRRIAYLGLAMALLIGLGVAIWLRHISGNSRNQLRFIAVLPLENLSGDPNQEYFADGLTDALITDLARIPALKVVSRTSIMQYKGVRKPLPLIARELGADAIVEGTVARSGDRVRVTAQLIDASKDRHLWADAYERNLLDVLSLENDIANDIAGQIRIQLTPEQQRVTSVRRPATPEVLNSYLQGRNHWSQRTEQSLRQAVADFERVIQFDPEFAPAYAGLADTYILMPFLVDSASQAELYPRAKEAARRALTLDVNSFEAHNSMASARFYLDWDFTGAEREFQQSIQLNPNYTTAHQWYADFLSTMGRHQEAIAEIRRAAELDPLSLSIHLQAGRVLAEARDYDLAIDEYQKGLEMSPNYPRTYWLLFDIYRYKGMARKATDVLLRLAKISKDEKEAQTIRALAQAYQEGGDRAFWRKNIELSEFKRPAFYFGEAYARLGDSNRAFFWLEKAYQEHDHEILYMKNAPDLDGLRSNHRFAELARKVGLPN